MKTKVGIESSKGEEKLSDAPPPVPDFMQPQQPQHTTIIIPTQVKQPGSTCWYVFGILSTIFCCLPCGAIGLVHAMIAKHEGEKGNHVGQRRRLYQAKCWISWSIALGVVMIVLISAYVIVVSQNTAWENDYSYEYEERKHDKDWNDDEEWKHDRDWDEDEEWKHDKDWDDDEEWKHDKDWDHDDEGKHDDKDWGDDEEWKHNGDGDHHKHGKHGKDDHHRKRK